LSNKLIRRRKKLRQEGINANVGEFIRPEQGEGGRKPKVGGPDRKRQGPDNTKEPTDFGIKNPTIKETNLISLNKVPPQQRSYPHFFHNNKQS
jgi:hypothetical protein